MFFKLDKNMKTAIHKVRTSSGYTYNKLVIGNNPIGPRGGTSGNWVDGKSPFNDAPESSRWLYYVREEIETLIKSVDGIEIDVGLIESLSRKRSSNIGNSSKDNFKPFQYLESHPYFKKKTEITNFFIYEFQSDSIYDFISIKIPRSPNFKYSSTYVSFVRNDEGLAVEKKLKKKEYPQWFKELDESTKDKCEKYYRIKRIFNSN